MLRHARIATLLAALALVLCSMFDLDSTRDVRLAARELERRDSDLALRLASRALLLGSLDDEQSAQARLIRVQAAMRLKNQVFALAELDRLVRERPEHDKALSLRGELFLRDHKYADALRDLDLALTLAQKRSGPAQAGLALRFAFRGQAHCGLGRWEQGRQDAQTALELGPTLPEAHYLASLLAEHEGRPAEALQSMETACSLKEGRSGYLYILNPQGEAWLHRLVKLRLDNNRDPLGQNR